jgi:hypothetical protein
VNAKQYIRLMGGVLSSSPNCRKLDRYCTKISRMFFYKRVSKRVSKLETGLPKLSQSNHGNYSLSSLISWRECVGVEPTREQEAVLATVLKFGKARIYSYALIRNNLSPISLLPSAEQIQTVADCPRTITNAIKKGCQRGCHLLPSRRLVMAGR